MSNYIERNIKNTFLKLTKQFPVIMITGPRQVGKTTFLNNFSANSKEKINYVSLDDLKVRRLAKEDPELFLNTYKTPLIIDEFQYAPELLSYIKIIVDKKRLENLENDKVKCNGLYFLTGSQLFHTMKNISESLAGRVGILDLYGLKLREIDELTEDNIFLPDKELLIKREKTYQRDVISLYEIILKGSYPKIYQEGTESEQFYSTYIRTYIERDIRELINVQDENKFLKFVESVAARTAQELNINDICNDVEINNATADKWLSILVRTGIVYLLHPYSNNTIARIVKRPKIYFMDTGLACYLSGYMSATTLEKSAYNGAIFETFVVSEIIKSFSNNGKDPRKYLYYYRDNNGKEIDLLIIFDNTVYPIEIKKSTNPGIEAIKNFDIVKKFGMNIGNGGVICMADEIFPIDNTNNFIPINLL